MRLQRSLTWKVVGGTPPKTNMTMESHQFLIGDTSAQIVVFSIVMLVFEGVYKSRPAIPNDHWIPPKNNKLYITGGFTHCVFWGNGILDTPHIWNRLLVERSQTSCKSREQIHQAKMTQSQLVCFFSSRFSRIQILFTILSTNSFSDLLALKVGRPW